MKSLAERFLTVFLVALCFPLTASAQSPYRTEVSGDISAVQSLAGELRDGAVRVASPLRASRMMRLSFVAKGLGKIDAQLTSTRFKDWESYVEGPLGKRIDSKDVILVSGFIKKSGKKTPVSGSIYRSNGHPRLFLIVNSTGHSRRSVYLRVRLDSKNKVLPARVSSLPPSAMSSLECGADGGHVIGNSLKELGGQIISKGIITGGASILTHADPEYYAAYGADTNAHIATLINAASAIYQSQMGIYLTIASQHVYTSQSGNPYTATDSGQLLTQFQNNLRSLNVLNNATAFHLFSGKDFNGSVIGLAYVGAICAYADYSVGTTQRYNALADSSIFAHEFGHNLGATHDSTDSHSMMAPYVNVPGATYFSPFSIGQIQSHLSSSDTCLDQSGIGRGDGGGGGVATPTPTPNDPENPSVAPEARIAVTVNRLGQMTITMGVDVVQDGCALQLRGATNANSSGQVLKEFTPTGTTTRIRLAGLKDPRSGKSILYFRARNVCTDDSAMSDPAAVNLNTIRSKTSLSIDRVLQSIGNAFAQRKRTIK